MLEEATAAFKRKALYAAVAAGLAGMAPGAEAQSISELKDQIDVLQRKVAEIEPEQVQAKKEPPPLPANVVTQGSMPGSFKLPDSGTSIKIGGYVKLDAIWSSRSAGTDSINNQLLNGGGIPVGPGANANDTNHLTVHARESRLNVATSTPSQYGDLTTFIEGDFFGSTLNGTEVDTNSNGFRVRHAWGTLGHFGAGQYWTNFMYTPSFADTLDFGGPVGTIFVRQAQVRWTDKHPFGQWAISLEEPESIVAVPGTGTLVTADSDRVPDIVGSIVFEGKAGKFWFGSLVRDIRIDSGAAPAATQNKWGAALSAQGVIPTGERDDFKYNFYTGNSIGRYQPLGFFPDGVVNTTGGLGLPRVVGGFGAFRHFWKENLRSSLVLSASRGELPSGTFGGINKSDESAHMNLIWTPVRNVDLGMELIHARRELENGQTGSLNRVQFSSKFTF